MGTLKAETLRNPTFQKNSAAPLTIAHLVARRAVQDGNRLAFTYLAGDGRISPSLTYVELHQRALGIARELIARELTGERVLLLFPHGLDFICAFLGSLYAGVIAVPSNFPTRSRHLPRVLSIYKDCTPAAVLSSGPGKGQLTTLLNQLASRTIEPANILETDFMPPEVGREWVLDGPAPDIAMLQYTSGSTSEPKGVMVSHENLLHNQEMIKRAFRQDHDSIVAGWLPLFHDMGLIGNVLQPLYCGAQCVLMPPSAFLQRPLQWLQAISDYKATTSGGPNFAFDLCVRKVPQEDRSRLDLSRWRVAFTGSEPVRSETIAAFADAFQGCGFRADAFYPCYGLAEATLFVTGATGSRPPRVGRFDRTALENGKATASEASAQGVVELVSCGASWGGQQLVISDPETGGSRPDAEIGEIWIAGRSIAQGYWNRSELTDEVFRAQWPASGERFLRTGDLGFILDGELFITGRVKDLIIIRGRNLYPQDLELAAGQAHSALEPNAAAAFAIQQNGQEEVVLVQEVRRARRAPLEEIAAAVRAAIVAEFDIAVRDVVLLGPGSLPRTTSRKVRRSFCRGQYLAGALQSVQSGTDVASETPSSGKDTDSIQERIRSLVAGVIGVPSNQVWPDVALSSAGLDSLKAFELSFRLEEQFCVSIAPSDLLSGVTLRDLSSCEVRGTQRVAANYGVGQTAPLGLTPGQRDLYALESLVKTASPNNIFGAGWVSGVIELAALQRAAHRVMLRHAALRTTFKEHEEGAPQIHVDMEPDVAEWTIHVADEIGIKQAIVHEGERPFNLVRGPLFRIRVIRTPDFRTILLLCIHHIVADLRSLEIIIRDTGAFYAEELGGETARLPNATQFSAFVAWQQDWLTSPAADGAKLHWQEQLADAPGLNLPIDFRRNGRRTLRGGVERIEIPAHVVSEVKRVTREHEATLHTFLLTLFQTFLSVYTSQKDIVVGSSVLGRPNYQFLESVGYFVNPLPFRCRFEGSLSFAEILRQNSAAVRRALVHANLPASLLANHGQLSGVHGASKPFDVFFVLEEGQLNGMERLPLFALGEAGASVAFGPLKLSSIEIDRTVSQFDLLLYAAQSEAGLKLVLAYNTDLFAGATARSFLQLIAILLRSAIAKPQTQISDLAATEASQYAASDRESEHPIRCHQAERPLHQIFQGRAAATPDAIAVVHGVEEINYRDLDERSNSLAALLTGKGIVPESRVPLYFEPGIDMIVAILGVLKAGGVYVPLDPHQPADRLDYMICDSLETGECAVFLTMTTLRERCLGLIAGHDYEIVLVDFAAGPVGPAPNVSVHPENVAYVIYTSGSTGRPKGVLNTHANVVRLFEQTRPKFLFGADDVWTMFHSYSFDFSTWEIWGALLYGGRLVIVPYETSRSPERFYRLLRSEGVTMLSQTPTAFRQLISLPEPWDEAQGVRLRFVVFGGEALDLSSLAEWVHNYQGSRRPSIVNMYGITETTVHVTYCELQPEDIACSSRSLIGRPIPDLQVYLLNSSLKMVPPGAMGEIFVAGAGLARGYLNMPALTAERFIPNPFSGIAGDRLYRSGDLARCLPDGSLEYLGRADDQVKIRGHRIEIGEVQHAISQHPDVEQALVIARKDRFGDNQLVAYLLAPCSHGVVSADLREFVAERLPDYMVPSFFVSIDAFPLTVNGKIDRAALPQPEDAKQEPELVKGRPLTPTEASLAMIWTELLGCAEPSPRNDFFYLGGHSLLAARMTKRMREVFGAEIPISDVFSTPTLAVLASKIDALSYRAPAQTIPAVPERREFPLSFAQERVWIGEQMRPGSPLLNIPIALELTGPVSYDLVCKCFNALVQRHELLRSCCVQSSQGPVQQVAALQRATVPLVDLSKVPVRLHDKAVEQLIRDYSSEPIQLAMPPLFRARLLRLESERHVLFLNMHHIVSDLLSAGILLNEFLRLYAAALRDESDPLPEQRIQYGDFAFWERAQDSPARFEKQLAFWGKKLSGIGPGFEMPTDYPRPSIQNFSGAVVRIRIDHDLSQALQTLRREEGVTLYVFLLTAFKVMLLQYSHCNDIIVGSDVAVREPHDVQPLLGMFVNQVVLRTWLDGNISFREALKKVRETTAEAWANASVPSQLVFEKVGSGRQTGTRSPFRVLFDLQNVKVPGSCDTGFTVKRLDTQWGTSKYDVSLFIEEEGTDLQATLEYSTELFEERSALRLLNHYKLVLETATRDLQKPIQNVSLLEQPAQRELAQAFNEAF